MATSIIDGVLKEFSKMTSEYYGGMATNPNKVSLCTMSDDEYSYRLRRHIHDIESKGGRVSDATLMELRKVTSRLMGTPSNHGVMAINHEPQNLIMSNDEYCSVLRKRITEIAQNGGMVPQDLMDKYAEAMSKSRLSPGMVIQTRGTVDWAYGLDASSYSFRSQTTAPAPVKKDTDKLDKIISYFYKRR